jgi:membrane associated rhomboid family serine protease
MRGRRPVLTAIVGLLTLGASLVALTHPDVLRLLERHPDPTASGPRWQLLTSLLVHDGWFALTFNLLGLGLVGAALESRVGPAAWAAIYFGGGLVGEVAGVWWQPVGAGNSVAAFALAGALLVLESDAEATRRPLAVLYATQWVLVFTGLALGGVAGAVVAAVVGGPLNVIAMRSTTGPPRRLTVVCLVGVLTLALILTAIHDIHGPPIIAGALGGVSFRYLDRRRRVSSP